jgi:hypothetical protein
VDDHPRRVEDALQPRRPGRAELRLQELAEIARLPACTYLFTRACKDRARGIDGERVVARPGELVD